jgi:hypothetical protein
MNFVKHSLVIAAAASSLFLGGALHAVPAAEAATDISYKASGDWYGAIHKITVNMPSGAQVPLDVTVFARGAENVDHIKRAEVVHTVRSNGRQGAVVEIAVNVPHGANGAVLHTTGSVQNGNPNGQRIFVQRGGGVSGQAMVFSVNLS